MRTKRKAASLFIVAAATALGAAVYAASPFEGVWKVQDTKGNPYEITLAADGTAKANRAGEGMKGTWKETGDTVAISWDTGWTTKIMKDGSAYKKVGYAKGKEADAGAPTSAEKVK